MPQSRSRPCPTDVRATNSALGCEKFLTMGGPPVRSTNILAEYRRRREQYIANWTSRMGEEAAGYIFQFRVLGITACALVVGLQTVAIAAMAAHAFLAAYVVYGVVLLVAVPMIFYSIRPLHKGMTIIRQRYGVPFRTRTRFPWSSLTRPEVFDRWILENRTESRRQMR